MLRGISPQIGPELLDVLYRMGHGNELVLGDAHFTGESLNKRVIRADGLSIPSLLDAILPLFPLDDFVEHPVIMMQAVPRDRADPQVERGYREVIDRYYPDTAPIHFMERFAFYDRAREAFAVVMSGDTAKYGNIIITKAVIR